MLSPRPHSGRRRHLDRPRHRGHRPHRGRRRHLDRPLHWQGRELDGRAWNPTRDAGEGIDLVEGVPCLHEAVEVDLEAAVCADRPISRKLGGEIDELVDGDVFVVDDGDAQDVGKDVLVVGDDAFIAEVVLVRVHVDADDGVASKLLVSESFAGEEGGNKVGAHCLMQTKNFSS